MQIKKKGDEIKKKSSPLKLLSQSQPNFAEMILGWSFCKINKNRRLQTTTSLRSEIKHFGGPKLLKNCSGHRV
jgi:hypothetical protein